MSQDNEKRLDESEHVTPPAESPPTDPLVENDTSPVQVTDMEVHHHGHVHENKKWKEYLFQFLMLFLAVTLGFFIENQREHYIEKQRAGVIAQSLYADLKSDTSMLMKVIKAREEKVLSIDSFMFQLNIAPSSDSFLAELGARSLVSRRYFFSESGTYEQVKNSGALRYYNLEIQKALVKYEALRQSCALIQDIENKFIMEQVMPYMMAKQNLRAFKMKNRSMQQELTVFRQPLSVLVDDFYNYAYFIRGRTEVMLSTMKTLLQHITQLIGALQKDYKLE